MEELYIPDNELWVKLGGDKGRGRYPTGIVQPIVPSTAHGCWLCEMGIPIPVVGAVPILFSFLYLPDEQVVYRVAPV